MNENNGGFGIGAAVIVILLVLAMAGGGLWGNTNAAGNCGLVGQTAAETSAMIAQNNTANQVAKNASSIERANELLNGIAQGSVTIGNKIDRNQAEAAQYFGQARTDLCQLGNNLTQQINALSQQGSTCCCELKTLINEHFCRTNQNILNSENTIIRWLEKDKADALAAENAALRTAAAEERAKCDRDRLHQETMAEIAALRRSCCCTPTCATPSSGCCNNGAEVTILQQIAGSLVTLVQESRNQYNALMTAIGKIPTTTTPATAS